jgi:hypothetical protein
VNGLAVSTKPFDLLRTRACLTAERWLEGDEIPARVLVESHTEVEPFPSAPNKHAEPAILLEDHSDSGEIRFAPWSDQSPEPEDDW